MHVLGQNNHPAPLQLRNFGTVYKFSHLLYYDASHQKSAKSLAWRSQNPQLNDGNFSRKHRNNLWNIHSSVSQCQNSESSKPEFPNRNCSHDHWWQKDYKFIFLKHFVRRLVNRKITRSCTTFVKMKITLIYSLFTTTANRCTRPTNSLARRSTYGLINCIANAKNTVICKSTPKRLQRSLYSVEQLPIAEKFMSSTIYRNPTETSAHL